MSYLGLYEDIGPIKVYRIVATFMLLIWVVITDIVSAVTQW